MARDNFKQPIKDTIAERVAYRCSNPTCRKLTARPHPTNPAEVVHSGVAAHITAASPGGPRYDAKLTTEYRASAVNGIWLCNTCSRIIDDAEDLYTIKLLTYWKSNAEKAAAKAARAGTDFIGEIQSSIDIAHGAILSFTERWEISESGLIYNRKARKDWDKYTQSIMEHSVKRRAAYEKEVAPLITTAITKATEILGETDPLIQDLKHEMFIAPTNYISMRRFATSLLQLRSSLELQ